MNRRGQRADLELVASADDGSELRRSLIAGVGFTGCAHCGRSDALFAYVRRGRVRLEAHPFVGDGCARPTYSLHSVGACCTVLCALRRVRYMLLEHPELA